MIQDAINKLNYIVWFRKLFHLENNDWDSYRYIKYICGYWDIKHFGEKNYKHFAKKKFHCVLRRTIECPKHNETFWQNIFLIMLKVHKQMHYLPFKASKKISSQRLYLTIYFENLILLFVHKYKIFNQHKLMF